MKGGPAADLVVVNGRVFVSGRPGRPLPRGSKAGPPPPGAPTAVAIRGEQVMGLGTDRQLAGWRGPRTEIVDAKGGLVMPGFDDTHLHLRLGAPGLQDLDLFGLVTLEAVQSAIAAYAERHAGRPWLVGGGWLYAAFPGGLPVRQQLDAVVADRPAYFDCFDRHSGWANSQALQAAGIDAATPDPRDGRIVRDAAGQPTGALKERATELVKRHIPEPSEDERVVLFNDALLALAPAGITAAQDAWGRPDDLLVLDRVRDRHGLPLRFRLGLEIVPGLGERGHAQRLDEFEELTRGRWDDPWLRAGVLKGFVDGVVEARTAYLLEPYPGTDTRGDGRWSDDELASAVAEAHRRGWQVKLHAIGTAAVRQALDAYEQLGPGAAAGARHRVEHIETIHPDDVPRFARLGVVASVQPFHAVPDADQMDVWTGTLGPELASTGWRLASLARSGAILAFGSDWPVVPFDPFLEIHAAVTRTTVDGRPAGGWLPRERLTISQALAAATWGSAFAEGADDWRGSLAAGNAADLIVLDRDLLAEDASAILGTHVLLTVCGGRIVHRAA
jgi:hypothetical protein